MKNISNYNCLLEQNLLVSQKDPAHCVDAAQGSGILMTNLTHDPSSKNDLDFDGLMRKTPNASNTQSQQSAQPQAPDQKKAHVQGMKENSQKSILGSRLLKYGTRPQ